ncbi:MAG TPA: efflux transporter outer membrane subunit [Burkholderiales bacterium]|nr:efflux transporter outer membrane subunit [Burkholderiales bacterium]
MKIFDGKQSAYAATSRRPVRLPIQKFQRVLAGGRALRVVRGLCLASLCSVVGCAVGPDFVPPSKPSVGQYTHGKEPSATLNADGQAQHFEPGAEVVGDWWRLFNSDKLDSVVKEAVTQNQNIQSAQASLRQSRAQLQAGYGVFYPQIDAGFSASRQRSSPARVSGNVESSVFNLFTLSAVVSYTLDVFGGERRNIENLQALVEYQRYTLLATYLTLTGNIVNATIAQAAYAAEIEATQQLVDSLKEEIKITEAQAQAGTIPYSNLLSLQSQSAAIEATLPPIRQKLNQTEHLLATLAGRAPADWQPQKISLEEIALPENLPLTLPSEVVGQRPDILEAEALLHSSSAQIGIATAALFPSFTINAGYGLNNTSAGNLFGSNSSFWSIGGGVVAPLFHGGTLLSQRQAAIEGYQQSLSNYRQTVLGGLEQVADTLRALEHDAETLQAESNALTTAEEALSLIRTNYRAGTVSYLQVLIATTQFHQAQIGYLQAKAQRLQDTVALYVALGGGWWNGGNLVPANAAAG